VSQVAGRHPLVQRYVGSYRNILSFCQKADEAGTLYTESTDRRLLTLVKGLYVNETSYSRTGDALPTRKVKGSGIADTPKGGARDSKNFKPTAGAATKRTDKNLAHKVSQFLPSFWNVRRTAPGDDPLDYLPVDQSVVAIRSKAIFKEQLSQVEKLSKKDSVVLEHMHSNYVSDRKLLNDSKVVSATAAGFFNRLSNESKGTQVSVGKLAEEFLQQISKKDPFWGKKINRVDVKAWIVLHERKQLLHEKEATSVLRVWEKLAALENGDGILSSKEFKTFASKAAFTEDQLKEALKPIKWRGSSNLGRIHPKIMAITAIIANETKRAEKLQELVDTPYFAPIMNDRDTKNLKEEGTEEKGNKPRNWLSLLQTEICDLSEEPEQPAPSSADPPPPTPEVEPIDAKYSDV